MKLPKHFLVKLADRVTGEVSAWRFLGFANRLTHECAAGRGGPEAPKISTSTKA